MGVVQMEVALMAVAAAAAVSFTAWGTAYAQARIGAAGAGAIAERPEVTPAIIIMLAIPETMIILGFVVAALILLVQR